MDSLQALSPLDGRYQALAAPLRAIFCEQGLMRQRVRVEVSWLLALSEQPVIRADMGWSQALQDRLQAVVAAFDDSAARRIKSIEARSRHDVKAVEEFLREQVDPQGTGAPVLSFIHFACTSEDINNLAYALMLQEARRDVLLPELRGLAAQLASRAHAHASMPLLARTHGQPASPTTLGKEWANVAARLQRQLQQLSDLPILGKCNGAVGNFNAHQVAYPEVDWLALSERFVCGLGLAWNAYTTQIEPHDGIAELCDVLRRINIILIDWARDCWGYLALGHFRHAHEPDQVGSSTMPHKVNPIDFENAEGNLGLSNALLSHFSEKLPISRWQRDLSDSTVLRSLGSALGHQLIAVRALRRGLDQLAVREERLREELEQNWSVLGEAVQTVMRRHAVGDAYEQLRALTQGQAVTRERLHAFIRGTPLPEEAKQRLLALTPHGYLGLAERLARSLPR